MMPRLVVHGSWFATVYRYFKQSPDEWHDSFDDELSNKVRQVAADSHLLGYQNANAIRCSPAVTHDSSWLPKEKNRLSIGSTLADIRFMLFLHQPSRIYIPR